VFVLVPYIFFVCLDTWNTQCLYFTSTIVHLKLVCPSRCSKCSSLEGYAVYVTETS
jgi:hypothetical protein